MNNAVEFKEWWTDHNYPSRDVVIEAYSALKDSPVIVRNIKGSKVIFERDEFINSVNTSIIRELFSKKSNIKNVVDVNFNTDRSADNTDCRVVAMGDLHIPFHNRIAVKNVFDFISDYQPQHLVMCGDILDFYNISSFDKDPMRMISLQDEINEFYELFKNFKKDVCACEMTFIEGNHENRLQRAIWKNPQFAGIKSLELPKLLRLDELGMNFKKYNKVINNFEFKHGNVVRQHSSFSAKAEYEKHGRSGLSGHTHRIGKYCKTLPTGEYGWYENSCLCELTPEYISGTPNWQNGFSTVEFVNNESFVNQVQIKGNKFVYGSRLYG